MLLLSLYRNWGLCPPRNHPLKHHRWWVLESVLVSSAASAICYSCAERLYVCVYIYGYIYVCVCVYIYINVYICISERPLVIGRGSFDEIIPVLCHDHTRVALIHSTAPMFVSWTCSRFQSRQSPFTWGGGYSGLPCAIVFSPVCDSLHRALPVR